MIGVLDTVSTGDFLVMLLIVLVIIAVLMYIVRH